MGKTAYPHIWFCKDCGWSGRVSEGQEGFSCINCSSVCVLDELDGHLDEYDPYEAADARLVFRALHGYTRWSWPGQIVHEWLSPEECDHYRDFKHEDGWIDCGEWQLICHQQYEQPEIERSSARGAWRVPPGGKITAERKT